MDREQRTIKAIAEAIARGECPPRTTPREWTNFEKQAKAVFYDLVLTVQLHDDDDESPAKAATVLHPAIREGVEAAFEGRDGWMTKIAAAVRHLPAEDAKVGGDGRDTLSRAIDCLEILNKRPSPLCRDCADNFGTCPHTGLACDMAALIKKARAALSADGGKDKRDAERLDFMIEQQAWVQWTVRDGSIRQCQVYTQDEDENYHILSGEDRFFSTPREAIDAAIAANQARPETK